MNLTHELLADIAARASGFDERLGNAHIIPQPELDEGEIDRRLERWCEVAAKGDREQFQKLLTLDGLDLDSVRTGLGRVQFSALHRFPEWTDLLQDGLNAVDAWRSESPPFLDAMEPWPFEQIMAPFVQTASHRLRVRAGEAYDGLAPRAHAGLERKLLYRLVNVCGSALILEFSIFRLKRRQLLDRDLQSPGDTSSKIYRSYLAHLRGGGLAAFFHEYSVLARAVATLMKNWIDSAAEFLTRLTSDRKSLSNTFEGEGDLGRVEELSPDLSDPHRGGRHVFALTFSSGLKLVYKPKGLETEEAYSRLLEWINREGISLPLNGVKVLSRQDYGWAEFVEHTAASNEAERARFYRRSGMLLCLFYVLDSTDVHFENLIAAGEQPVLIDAETLITPSLDEDQRQNSDAETIAVHRLNTSVLRVGMLPWWSSLARNQSGDLSALGSVGGEELITNAWQGIGTDNLERQAVKVKVGRNGNAPFSADEAADPVRYVEEVVTGFGEMYQLLLAHREALLAANSPLDHLARLPMRLVFRETSTYYLMLKNSLDAALLRDGADHSIHFEALSRVLLVSDSNVRFAPFLKSEKQALMGLDIPFFTVSPQSRAMTFGSAETVENCFAQTGYDRVRAHLFALGNQNLEEQIGIIRGSFWAKAASLGSQTGPAAAAAIPPIDVSEPQSWDLIDAAVCIGRRLQHEAILGSDGSITWISLSRQTDRHNYRLSQLSPGLFDGLAGVAFFLAALEKFNPGAGFRQTALGTLVSMRRALTACEKMIRTNRKSSPQNLTLGLTGLGSIVYALTRIGQMLQEEAAFEIAQAAAALIALYLSTGEASVDVFNGCAGAILGLLSLCKIRLDPSLLHTATACGDMILKRYADNRPASLADGLAGGFALGPAGVGHALLRLYKATNEQRFLHGARKLIPALSMTRIGLRSMQTGLQAQQVLALAG